MTEQTKGLNQLREDALYEALHVAQTISAMEQAGSIRLRDDQKTELERFRQAQALWFAYGKEATSALV